ncbi:MAG: hypothetical protein NZQ09_17260 [Chloroflexus sp.]|nr:hypothetical protein [Chloroflexus sp.]
MKALADGATAAHRNGSFQSPHGDFGFLKISTDAELRGGQPGLRLSIPSRGFWFLEGKHNVAETPFHDSLSIPSRGFWFFEGKNGSGVEWCLSSFQSPHGDFGFLKRSRRAAGPAEPAVAFNPLTGILVF